MERVAKIYHGTTATRAKAIEDAAEFDQGKDLYFVMGLDNVDLAEIFARRASSRWPTEGGPVLVTVQVEEKSVERLRRNKLLKLIGFDPEDRPELRNRFQ